MAEPMTPQEHARQAAITAALAELQAEYAESLPNLVADLNAAGEAACSSGDGAALRHLQTLAHRMHGAGGSYGFRGVSLAAAELEVLLANQEQAKRPFDAVFAAKIRAALEEVEAVTSHELAGFAAARAGSAI